jgi:hypothetical protein
MLTPRQKDAAREHAEATKDASADLKVGAAFLAIPAAAQGVLGAYALVAAVLLALFERQARKAERAANDPPRGDYDSQTLAQRPRVYPSVVLQGTLLEEPGVVAAEEVRTYVALLSAFVRAVERAQGAILTGDPVTARLHAEEATRFADGLSAAGARLVPTLSLVADRMRGVGTDGYSAADTLPPPSGSRGAGRLLPRDIRNRLERGGIRPTLVKPLDKVPSPEIFDRIAESIQNVAQTAARFTRSISTRTAARPRRM